MVTVAGSGRAGFKDGKGGEAALSEPGGLAVAPGGARTGDAGGPAFVCV